MNPFPPLLGGQSQWLSGGCEGQVRPDSKAAACATGHPARPARSLDVAHCVPRSVLEMPDLVSPGETRLCSRNSDGEQMERMNEANAGFLTTTLDASVIISIFLQSRRNV